MAERYVDCCLHTAKTVKKEGKTLAGQEKLCCRELLREREKVNPNDVFVMDFLALLLVVTIQGLSLSWYSNMVLIPNLWA